MAADGSEVSIRCLQPMARQHAPIIGCNGSLVVRPWQGHRLQMMRSVMKENPYELGNGCEGSNLAANCSRRLTYLPTRGYLLHLIAGQHMSIMRRSGHVIEYR